MRSPVREQNRHKTFPSPLKNLQTKHHITKQEFLLSHRKKISKLEFNWMSRFHHKIQGAPSAAFGYPEEYLYSLAGSIENLFSPYNYTVKILQSEPNHCLPSEPSRIWTKSAQCVPFEACRLNSLKDAVSLDPG